MQNIYSKLFDANLKKVAEWGMVEIIIGNDIFPTTV